MRIVITGPIVAACCLVSAHAIAQETGTLIPKRAAQIQTGGKDAARKTMDAFAACLVSRSPGRVAKLAEIAVDTPQYRKHYTSLFDTLGDECLSGGDLGFSPLIIRGGLFSALYAREFKLDPPLAFAPELSSGYRALYSEPLSAEARSSIALVTMAECVARAEAVKVRDLLQSISGSQFEDQSFRELTPTIGACVVKDSKITFSKSILKGVLAEGLYRLSVAARATAAPK